MASTDSPKSDSGKKKRDNGDEVARRRAEAERLVALRREALKKEQEEKLRKINAQLEKDRKERARILHEKELLRQKQVLDRRQAQLEAEQAKKQAILAKAHEVASRTSKKAQNSYAFGSSTPRQLDYLTNLSREQKVYDRRLSPASPPKTVASPMTASMYAPRTQQRTPAPRLSPPKVTCSAPASNLMTQSMYAHQKSTPVRPSSAVKSFPIRDTRRGTNAKTPAPVHPAKDAQVQKKPPIPRPRKIDPPVNSSITKSAQLEQIISKSSTNTSVSDVIDEETVLESSKEGVATRKEDSGRVESTTEDSLVRFFEEKMQLLDAPASTENAKIEDSSPLSTTDESPISVISNDVPDLLLSGETDVEEKESTTPVNNNSLQNGHSSAQNGAAELADMDFINPDGSGNLVSFVDTSENSKGEQDEVIASKAESVANQLTENIDQDILEVSTPHFNISTLKDGSSNCNGAGVCLIHSFTTISQNEISLKDELAFLNTDKLSSVGLSEPIPEMRDAFDKDEEKSRRDVQMLQEEEILRRQEEESRQEEEVKSQLLTKMQQEQQEREDRKARLAAIMNRTRTGGGLPVKETQANPTESSLSALQKIAQIGGSQRLQGLLQKHASNPNLEDGTQLPGAVPDDPHVIYPPALSPTQSQL